VEILKQPQYSPYSVEKQVAIIYLGTNNLIRKVPVKNVKAFEETFLQQMELKLPDVLKEFKKGALPDNGIEKMVKLAEELIPQFA
jgi:F-type H+/Na+-transporting ATPase subunit alpha